MKKEILTVIKKFKNKKIAIVGDLMLDKYVWGTVDRISPEAPVPIIDVAKDEFKIGAAGNVALNISSLGGEPHLLSVIGNDGYGRMLRDLLKEKRIFSDGVVIDDTRKTTLKIRVIASSQQVVRIDYEDRHSIPRNVHSQLINSLNRINPEAVIIEDYNKGLLTRNLIVDICKFARKKKILCIADPHPTRDYSFYKGVDSITPNRKEAYKLLNLKYDVPIDTVGKKLLSKLKMDFSMITLGENGMKLFWKGKIKHIPTHAREVFDVTGAGDTVISILALALACGAKPETATFIANIGAGLVVSEIGAATVTPDQIIKEILSYEKIG